MAPTSQNQLLSLHTLDFPPETEAGVSDGTSREASVRFGVFFFGVLGVFSVFSSGVLAGRAESMDRIVWYYLCNFPASFAWTAVAPLSSS